MCFSSITSFNIHNDHMSQVLLLSQVFTWGNGSSERKKNWLARRARSPAIPGAIAQPGCCTLGSLKSCGKHWGRCFCPLDFGTSCWISSRIHHFKVTQKNRRFSIIGAHYFCYKTIFRNQLYLKGGLLNTTETIQKKKYYRVLKYSK